MISGHDADSRSIVQMRFGRRQAANDEGHGDFGDCVGVVMRGGKQFYERRFGGSRHSEGRGFGPLLEGQKKTGLDIDIYGDMIPSRELTYSPKMGF